MKEPSVKIQMVDESSVNPVVDSDNIAGGVVIADCGTVGTKLYSGSTQVLKEFTKSGKISRNTDTTIIHAAAIADIMPILLKRSFADVGVRSGIVILSTAEDGAKDETVFTLTGLAAGVRKTFKTNGKKLIVSVSSDAKTIEFTPQFAFDSVGASLSGTLVELYTSYDGNVTYYPTSLFDSGVTTFETKQLANTTVVLEFQSAISVPGSAKVSITPKIKTKSVLTKKGALLNYSSVMTVDSSITPKNFRLAVDSTIYYNELETAPTAADFTKVPISGISNQSTMYDVVSAINALLKTKYIDYDGTTYTLYSLEAIDELTADSGNDYMNSYADADTALVGDTDYTIMVTSVNPSASPFTCRVKPNSEDDDLIDVMVETPSRTYEYSGSTDPEYVNQYGLNQFIENINGYSGIPFQIKVNGEVSAASVLDTGITEFGAMNVDSGKSTETRKAALEALCDQDDFKIAFLCPLGYVNNAYLNKLTTYNTKIWAFTPVGMYVEHDDPEEIVANRPSVNTEYAMIMAPHDKSTLMTDWVVDMTLEVAYLSRIQSNKSKRWEFAPMMGKENSLLTLTAPSVSLSKSTREALLDARIMSVISRNNKTIHYLNMNKCSAGDTVLSEDQNARLACKINRDLDTLLEPILGKFNIEETRNRVLKTINQYFTDNITNQVFSIDGYTPICNEDNNPAYIRANNQLVVDLSVTYLNAIYEVLVYHRALNVASNTE